MNNIPSERVYKNLFQSFDQSFYVIEITDKKKLSGTVIYISPYLHQFIDCSEEYLIKNTDLFISHIHPEDKKRIEDSYKEILANKKGAKRTYRIKNQKEDRFIWVEDQVSVVANNESKTTEIYCTIKDISENKETIELIENSHQELLNIDKINKAIIEDKNLDEISQIFLDTIEPVFLTRSSRLYTLNHDKNELELIAENVAEKFKKSVVAKIENKTGVKVKSLIPTLTEDNYLYQLIKSKKIVITTDLKEIRIILEAHANNHLFLKKFSKWAIIISKIKTFAVIPLCDGEKVVGLVTFASIKVLTENEKKSVIRYTEHVSGGLIKKIAESTLEMQKKLSNNIFDMLPLELAILDEDQKFIYANNNAVKDDELRKWVIGKNVIEYFIKEGRDNESIHALKNQFKELENKQQVNWITKVEDENGNTRHNLRNMKQISIDNIKHTIYYCVDVTELMTTQERLKETQRIGKLGSWDLNIQSGKIEFSDDILKILEIDSVSKEISFKAFYKLIDKKYKESFITFIKNITEYQVINNIEIALNVKGKQFFVQLNAIASMDKENIVQNVKGTILDITERKLAEVKLKASQQLLLTSEEMGKIGSWEVHLADMNDWSKNTCIWSDESYRIFGYEPGSFEVSFPFFVDHVHPEDKHLVTDFDYLFIPGFQRETEYRIILKDGNIKTIHGKFHVEFDEKNVPLKIIGMVQDITERKKIEEGIKSIQNRLLASQEIAKIGSWELEYLAQEQKLQPIFLSDETYRIFGYQPGTIDLNEDIFYKHTHPDDRSSVHINMHKAIEEQSIYNMEHRINLNDGTQKYLHEMATVKYNHQTNKLHVIGTCQDITERKILETALENYNKKLEEEVERQTMELTIANNNLDAFNYSISHDIKTPLRAMDMYIHLLQENSSSKLETQEFVHQLGNCVEEMKNMISSLLDFAKCNRIELKKEKINMSEKIGSCISSLTLNTSVNSPDFNILETPDLYGDKDLMINVLSNLISNAIKYSSKKEKPSIEISGTKDENYITYYIKDNGDGFDEKLKSKLFKPFSRLHNESEFEGNGAGLAIVERIISRHGGTIWAEAEKGKGATFYFKLPIHESIEVSYLS